jgi:hypothetical protein
MSIKSLANPTTKDWLNIYCKDINANNISVETFDFTDIKAETIEAKTINSTTVNAETFNINEYLINDIKANTGTFNNTLNANDIKAETAEIKTITGTNLNIGQIGQTGVNTVLVGLLDVFGQFNLNGQGGVYNVKEITGLSPTGQWLSLDLIPETIGASNQLLARHPNFTADPNAHKKLIWVDPPTGGGVSNPLTSELDCGNFNLTNVNNITASSIVLPPINSGLSSSGPFNLSSSIININDDINSTAVRLKGNIEFQTADAGQQSGRISHPTAVIIANDNLQTNSISSRSTGVVALVGSATVSQGLTVRNDIFLYNLWGNNIVPKTTLYKNTAVGVVVVMDTTNELNITIPNSFIGSLNVFNIPNKVYFNLRFKIQLMMTCGGNGNTTIYLNYITGGTTLVRLGTFGSFLTQTLANKGFEIDMVVSITKAGTVITAPFGFCAVRRHNNFDQSSSMTMTNTPIPATPTISPLSVSIQNSVGQNGGTLQVINWTITEE